MSSASDPNDEPSRRRSRSESDVAVPEQSAVAPAAPVWTLDTNVEVFLLRGAPPPAYVMLSAFLRGIAEDIVPTMDVCMSVFVGRPHNYIQNNRQRERVLNSQEFVAFELFTGSHRSWRGKQFQVSSSGQRVDAVPGLLRVTT
ncbi:hypothetical protein ERJ75_000611900 [Trypanosoma vivax]|nr:hypothetical protein ERJ75_000611900 [Trypanosoma vivax]